MNQQENEPNRVAWLILTLAFLVAMALWSWSQESLCDLCLAPQFFDHTHPAEAEHATEKYE